MWIIGLIVFSVVIFFLYRFAIALVKELAKDLGLSDEEIEENFIIADSFIDEDGNFDYYGYQAYIESQKNQTKTVTTDEPDDQQSR